MGAYGPASHRAWHSAAVACVFAAGAAGACKPVVEHRVAAGPVLAISVEQQATWVRNFNPFMTGKYRWPTIGPIYESLAIYSTAEGAYEPWLATSHAWSDDQRTLRFSLRPGVRWSDGTPFTARDVVFSFELARRHAAFDGGGIWQFLAAVHATADDEVTFELSRPFVPGFANLAQYPIVPEHIWSKLDDPTTFANPQPVGTGPFTEVTVFRHQIFELGRNPHYWQPERFAVQRLRFPALSSNEQAMLALFRGDLDWAGNFIPDIERVYVRRNRAHHGYWYPATGATVFLYANTARAPFDDVRVRKALSMAIDREQITRVAMYGYTRPSDATGLSDAYQDWRDPQVAAAGDWVRHDVARANALLDEAGYPRGPGGLRRGRDGRPLTYQIQVVSGWSDWVRACQLIAAGLREVGITASVKPYDFGAWFDRLQTGDFDLAISWSSSGVTPYLLYRDLMSSATVRPLGDKSGGNWHRFASREADELLLAFEAAEDPARQRAIMHRLAAVFSANAPAIPLFPGPAWGVYNARRWRGFPTREHPYAVLSPNAQSNYQAEYMLVLAALTPRERVDD
jgi:peptide/nickel transport system substrate-binding protein